MNIRTRNFRATAILSTIFLLPVVAILGTSASAANAAMAQIASPTCGNDALITLSNPTSSQVEFSLFRSTASGAWNVVYLSGNRTTTVHMSVAAAGETASVQVSGQVLASSTVKASTVACGSTTPVLPAVDTGGTFGASITAPSCGSAAQVVLNNGVGHDLWFNVQVQGASPPDAVDDLQANLVSSVTENIPSANAVVQVVWNNQILTQKTLSPAAPCVDPTTTTTAPPPFAPKTCTAADNLPSWGGCPKFVDNFSGSSVNTASNGWFVYNYPTGTDHPRVAANAVESGGVVQMEGTYNQKTQVALGSGMESQFAEKYGQFEVRAKVQKGAGFSGVSLLWPSGTWPTDGEIDLYEIPKDPRSRAFQVVHNDANNDQQGQWATLDATQWHTYEVQWTPTRVSFIIDGATKWTESTAKLIPSGSTMHMTLQMDPALDCGGWYECPNSTTPAVQSMSVDWVKAWSYGS